MNVGAEAKRMYSYVGGLVCGILAMLFGLIAITYMPARILSGVLLIIAIWQLFDEVHIYMQEEGENKFLCMSVKRVGMSQTGNQVVLILGFVMLTLQLVRIVLGDIHADNILPFSLCGLFWVFTANLKEYARKGWEERDSQSVSD